ncbi:hypothetical protein SCUCBS95973_008532 [Sporothrix curviconia]|uniref:Cytochrome P450 n=1 Tax=Sporothrix curviconia TaxID=1260050 RepID=A0ABP0CN43_9PEZI
MAFPQLPPPSSQTALAAAAASLLLYILFATIRRSQHSSLPLPPGPPRRFLVGNLGDVSADHPEEDYMRWGKEYDSDVIHVEVLGQHMIALNSVEAASELLDRRGSNYCDRPRFALFEVMGWGLTLTFLRWGRQFKLHRSLIQKTFTSSNVKVFRPIQLHEARKAVVDLLSHPDSWEEVTLLMTTSVIFRIAFGQEITDVSRKAIRTIHDVPWAASLKDIEAGTAPPSFMPVQKGVLEEIDAVLGVFGDATSASGPRLPTFEDRPALARLDRFLQEVHRSLPLNPLVIPHKSLRENEYHGMRIPAGSLVLANTKAMAADPRVYQDPDTFDPDRYVSAANGGRGEPYPNGNFGFGRRKCPGNFLAMATVYMFLATLLAVYEVEMVIGPDGNLIEPQPAVTIGLGGHPAPFQCQLKLRNPALAELLKEAA